MGASSEDRWDHLGRWICADLQDIISEADWLVRVFGERHLFSANDFRALLLVMVADAEGRHFTAGELRHRMGLSGAAITYVVDRLSTAGHVRRDRDPADRRKVMLRPADPGVAAARAFFIGVARHAHDHLAEMSDEDLQVAHRGVTALTAAMAAYRVHLIEAQGRPAGGE